MTLLSIVVPNHDYGRFADRFFGSIAAQSLPLDAVEVLFIDDGSTDDSVEKARQWSKRLSCHHFAIEAVDRIGRPGAVRNLGLSRATGEYLISLDPDDTLHPDFLATCIATLDANPDIHLVYTDYVEHTGETSREVRLPKFNQGHLRMQNTLPPVALYRREIWDAGVRYRENTDYEDWDFWVQCLMTGARFHHIPVPRYNYQLHGDNFSNQAQKNDGLAKALIVLNNPAFFHPLVREWADGYMRGRLHSQAFQRGHIPTPDDVRALLRTVEDTVLQASTS
ncbi:glycosyltransferase family 2 protein [Pseudodesulfovibrio sediminis]|uniref:Glycosyl transferase family 2 n=1 Tax=Pseudodesulfovibrio sediminis TaxID=2810563 RepID=A0ABN6ET16_9BACT|nr:glycosyltransferase [Pseudodesulfovibrio sediminis]BCS88563.1 glycosyl transferase family 2 [Pseudodesulfovibrio sediminis]